MKKYVCFLPLLCLVFQNMPMDHRITAKKMHERCQRQPRSYKEIDQQRALGKPREAHRPSIVGSYAGSCDWRTKFMAIAFCTMILGAEAAPIFNQSGHGFRAHQREDKQHNNEAVQPGKNSTTIPTFDDDGTSCLASEPIVDYQQICPVKSVVEPLHTPDKEYFSFSGVPQDILQMIVHYASAFTAKVNLTVAPVVTNDTDCASVAIQKTEKWSENLRRFAQNKPYLGFMKFSPHFFELHSCFQRGAILHELCHVSQFTEDEIYYSVDPTLTIEQECDARAILYLLLNESNIRCALDFSRSRPNESTEYLTESLAIALMDKAMPEWREELASREALAHLDSWAANF